MYFIIYVFILSTSCELNVAEQKIKVLFPTVPSLLSTFLTFLAIVCFYPHTLAMLKLHKLYSYSRFAIFNSL